MMLHRLPLCVLAWKEVVELEHRGMQPLGFASLLPPSVHSLLVSVSCRILGSGLGKGGQTKRRLLTGSARDAQTSTYNRA